jgi:Bacteriophage minor capsid protein
MSGILTHTPSEILLQLLIMQGLVSEPSLDDEWPGFYNHHPVSPDDLVCVYDTAGTIQGKTHVDGETQSHDGFNIRIRSERTTDGFAKANMIYNKISPITRFELKVDTSIYRIQSITFTSPVFSLGKDPESESRLHTINGVISVREVL